MVALNFDATNVEPSKAFTLLPPGRYLSKITDSGMKDTSKKDGKFLELTHEVIDGEFAGCRFTNNLNLENQNQTTVDIAYRTLSAICHAVGKIKIKDSSELHNLPLMVTLNVRAYTKQDGSQGSSNEVKGYEKASADSASSSAPASASASGSTGAAAQQPSQPGKPAWAQSK